VDRKCLYITLPELYRLTVQGDVILSKINTDCDCLILDGLNEMSDKGFDTTDEATRAMTRTPLNGQFKRPVFY
jgi:hypothetical protein